MNWDAMGAIGEIVGAMAVIGTLAYLALQIRIQNRDARLAANQDLQRAVREVTDSARNDPEMLQIFLSSMTQEMDSFDPLSAAKLSMFYQSIFRVWEGAYYQHQAKQLDKRLWPPLERVMSSNIAAASFRQWWPARSQFYSDDFVAYVNTIESAQIVDYETWSAEKEK